MPLSIDINTPNKGQDYSSLRALYLLLLALMTMQFFPAVAQATDQTKVPPLAKGQGFLLLDLDIKASSAQMALKPLGRSSKVVELKLVANHGRWLLHPLPQGEYQITQVNVPFFDLPHSMDTATNPRWRIRVRAGHLNYAGRIEIERERTERQISIRKLNRLATDLNAIQQNLQSVLVSYPLTPGSTLRDDFATEQLLNRDQETNKPLASTGERHE